MFRAAFAPVMGALALALGINAYGGSAPAQSPESIPRSASPRSSVGEPSEAEARGLCTSCHLHAPPDILPRTAWRDVIARMALIRADQPQPAGPPGTAARLVTIPPDFARALQFYESHAPVALPPPARWPDVDRRNFATRRIPLADVQTTPAISNVRLVNLDGDSRLELLAADMQSGVIAVGRPYEENATLRPIAAVSNPAHVSMVDFDKDGMQDFLVADLGRFLPSDHQQGAVVLLRAKQRETYETLALDGWPRVADVEAGDFNGDGTLDLIVAAFGWRKTGHLTLLENHTTDYATPSFKSRLLDNRPGAIHAIPVDLNRDGKLDIVAVFAQQFESVTAYINNGGSDVSFTPQSIYTAPHPNWGSSGIDVVDLDGDGDLDVVLTHGDTFDDAIIKPYHGIQWLENRGSFPFVEHTLAELPGACRAQAADLDGDGDLDIVAGTFNAMNVGGNDAGLPSLVWLEQQSDHRFTRHTLEVGAPWHATLDVADFDRDGDLDIVVGNFDASGGGSSADTVEIWENRHIATDRSTR